MLNKVMVAIFLIFSSVAMAAGEQEVTPNQILIKDVNIFNGKDNKLTPGNVLIEGNLIKAIGINVNGNEDATVIEGGRP